MPRDSLNPRLSAATNNWRLFIIDPESSVPDTPRTPGRELEVEVALPFDHKPLVTPVKPAALSLTLFAPLPDSGETLSTMWKGVRLMVRYLVDCELELPPPNRSNIDFTVLAIGEISHTLPALLLPVVEEFFDDLV